MFLESDQNLQLLTVLLMDSTSFFRAFWSMLSVASATSWLPESAYMSQASTDSTPFSTQNVAMATSQQPTEGS